MPRRTKGYKLNSNGFYVIDKIARGVRLYETTHYRKGQEEEIESYIAEKIYQMYQAIKRQQRPIVTFQDCAIEYLLRNTDQKQIASFEAYLSRLDPYIGHVDASQLHDTHPGIRKLKQDKCHLKSRSLNHYLEAINRVLKAATKWRYDWCDLTWLEYAPTIELLPVNDSTPPRPLSWNAQDKLLPCLPPHVQDEVLVYINTGLRDKELFSLEWENELLLPGDVMGFIADNKGTAKKKYRQKLIICNNIVRKIIERKRGDHPKYVFTYKGKPKKRARNTAWRNGVIKSGIKVTIHGLRYTFGHRLRAAGVDEETRAELLGHGVSLTTIYSASAIQVLAEAVSRIEERTDLAPVIDLMEYKRASKVTQISRQNRVKNS